MKISCPTCAAKYSVADEKIQSRLAKIRCRKCSSTIVIDGTASPASVYIGDAAASVSGPPSDSGAGDSGAGEATPGSSRFGGVGFTDPTPASNEPVGPAADEYAVDIADNDQRNMTIHQIVGAYNEGIITADTYIWKEGMADWQTLAEVKAVANALHAAARPAPPAAMPAAVRRADHGASADLFGSIDTAGGEDDITTSAPDAAPMMSAGTGARNESSVLFSLSALTGTPNPSPAHGGGGKRKGSADDSGLIDLQALTAAEAAGGGGGFAASAHPFGASPLISAPLGGVSGPALGGGLGSAYGGRRSGSRTLVIAATVLAISIIGGAAAVVVNRGGAGDAGPTSQLDKAAASGTEKVADPREPEPGNAEPAEPEPGNAEPGSEAAGDLVAADELPTAAPEAAAAKTPVSRPAAPRVARAPTRPKAAAPAPEPEPEASKPAPASASSTASSEKKEKKKKPAGRCECAPADLMCAMRCSAKK